MTDRIKYHPRIDYGRSMDYYPLESADDLREQAAALERDWGSDAANSISDLVSRAEDLENRANKNDRDWGSDGKETSRWLRGH